MTQEQSPSQELELRRLRYRLQRLGMLELEAWLAGLEPALGEGGEPVMRAAMRLMEMPTPQLLAMMHADLPIPDVLRPWLEVRAA